MECEQSEIRDVLLGIIDQVTQTSSDRLHSSEDVNDSADGKPRIKLIRMPGGIFVFDRKDIREIRTTERVLGTFCGPVQTMPSHLKLAPPLRLTPEEARLLLDRGRARLVSVSTEEEVLPLEKMRALEMFQRKILEFSNRERFKEKLESMCLARPNRSTRERLHPDEVTFNPTQYVRENPCTVQLVDSPFKVLVDDALFLRAKDPISELRYQVFSYLWQRGNFVTGGSNFSADFLLYEGDPSLYHAYACVYCLAPEGKLSALDIIRYCRIGSSVKKNIVIATIVDGQVDCLTLNWEA